MGSSLNNLGRCFNFNKFLFNEHFQAKCKQNSTHLKKIEENGRDNRNRREQQDGELNVAVTVSSIRVLRPPNIVLWYKFENIKSPALSLSLSLLDNPSAHYFRIYFRHCVFGHRTLFLCLRFQDFQVNLFLLETQNNSFQTLIIMSDLMSNLFKHFSFATFCGSIYFSTSVCRKSMKYCVFKLSLILISKRVNLVSENSRVTLWECGLLNPSRFSLNHWTIGCLPVKNSKSKIFKGIIYIFKWLHWAK